MTRRYAVVGNPVCHSRSPWLHSFFARQTQRDIVYAAVCPPLDSFATFADEFFRSGGCGLNITVPFKADALRFAARASDFATRAAAANVLVRRGEEIVAYNTDGGGFLRALSGAFPDGVKGKKILLLGAGGAARAVAAAMTDEKPAALWIYNRTAARAAELADLVGATAVSDYPTDADIIINATSAGLGEAAEAATLPAEIFTNAQLACDLSYGAAAVGFLRQARDGGARKLLDGSAMLAWQAAMSFAIWEGVMPPVSVVLPLLGDSEGVINSV